jgi:hypothetical protein
MNIEAVLKRHAPRLMELPNVWGVDMGEKEGRAVIRVHVEEKVPDDQLRSVEVVPKTIDGVETVVIEGAGPSAQVPNAENESGRGRV